MATLVKSWEQAPELSSFGLGMPLASLVPGFHGQRKECLVSAVCSCVKFSQKSGKPCYFGILPRNGHLQRQWQRVLISLGLIRINYTSEGYSDWKPWRNDCVVIVLLLLCVVVHSLVPHPYFSLHACNTTHWRTYESAKKRAWYTLQG